MRHPEFPMNPKIQASPSLFSLWRFPVRKENAENPMITTARIALTTGSGTVFSSASPKGMPNKVESTSHPALRI